MGQLNDKRVAVLAEEGYEDLELWVPYYRLLEEGAEVKVLGTSSEKFKSKHGYPVETDGSVADARATDYDAVVIPGGMAPDKMRLYKSVVDFVREMNAAHKVVAFICHAGSVAASADIVRGRTCTSWPSIRDDLKNAGAEWKDAEVVRDENLISSRKPQDLPAFCRTLVEALA
ncbi:MAG: type 1 glutamine amidotransferase [Deltaproteobacteria bacterium]|nr:type 1 glutamine amidotransferase [Deltaproteobacteria bacterium]